MVVGSVQYVHRVLIRENGGAHKSEWDSDAEEHQCLERCTLKIDQKAMVHVMQVKLLKIKCSPQELPHQIPVDLEHNFNPIEVASAFPPRELTEK